MDSTMHPDHKKRQIEDYNGRIKNATVSASDLDKKTGVLSSLPKLLGNYYGRQYFRKFLKLEHSEENLDFWLKIEEFKVVGAQKPDSIRETAKSIFEKYLSSYSTNSVNVSGKSLSSITDILYSDVQVDIHLFDLCQKEIFELMKSDSFERFLKHELSINLAHRLEEKPGFFDVGEDGRTDTKLSQIARNPHLRRSVSMSSQLRPDLGKEPEMSTSLPTGERLFPYTY